MVDSFVHLHNHSLYSALDGAAKIKDIVTKVKADGQPAVASTDHGNLNGVVDFYEECQKQEIKYVPGIELYTALESIDERPERKSKEDDSGGATESGQKINYHLSVMAKDNKGFQNLMKLSSDTFLKGFYYKPRADWNMLAQYSDGLMATSGCLGGVVLQALMHDDFKEGLHRAGRLQDIFGRENFFIEVQDHGIPEQLKTNPMLIDIAQKIGAKIIATNDCHYLNKDNSVSHDVLLCVQVGSKRHETDRFMFSSDQHWVKTSQEMREVFSDYPQFCDNTLLVAEMSDVSIEFGRDLLPTFPLPPDETSHSEYLKRLTFEGAKERYKKVTDRAKRDIIKSRLLFELETIESMGFSSYFLIQWDLIKYAKESGILTGPGRGSAAGCAVAYCLGITGIEPIEYKLYFERFLNPSRISLPDIDIDVDTRKREHLINYTSKKYGRDRVAQIITFSTLKGKSSLRDTARVLDKPYKFADELANATPPAQQGKEISLNACFDKENEFYELGSEIRSLYKNPEYKEVIDIALELEDLKRGDGVHAGGVIIAPDSITNYVPIQQRPDKALVTQWGMDICDKLGLLKMDLLGLKNLDNIDDTIHLIEDDIDLYEIDLNDTITYRMLSNGDTLGVFQFESDVMQSTLMAVQPETIHDLAAVVALCRPGPMGDNMHINYALRKNGEQEITSFHEDALPILSETYGLMFYQEQLMEIIQKFAGYSLAEADNMRKITGKKLPELMKKEKKKLINGCIAQGYGKELGVKLFKIVEPFSAYSFNKCLTGDTELLLGGSGGSSNGRISIGELYRRLNNINPPRTKKSKSCLECGKKVKTRGLCNGCYAWHIKFNNKGLTILSYDTDSRIRPKRIKNVYHNGVKKVYKMTLENGNYIKSTNNHKHLTDSGYKQLSEISVGESIVIHLGVDTKSSITLEELRTTDGSRQNKGQWLSKGRGFCSGKDNYGYIDGGFIKLKEWTKTAPDYCEECNDSESRLERAHLNGNRRDNSIKNLKILCVSCHKKHDYKNNDRNKRFEKGHLSGFSTVVSIEFVGEEEVFDIEMDTPEHNFVANGIVTHNSHAYGYATIAYWTAYLKANYPMQYISSLLTSAKESDKLNPILNYVSDRDDIEILPPDVNLSKHGFTPAGNTILFGLTGIKGMGYTVAKYITAEQENGPFESIFDFKRRVPEANKTTLSALIRCGGFDSFGHSRKSMMELLEYILLQESRRKTKIKQGKPSEKDYSKGILFSTEEFSPKEILQFEKELLGIYISGHPVSRIQDKLDNDVDFRIEKAHEKENVWATIGGVVSEVDSKKTRKGDLMSTIVLEDISSSMKITVFPKTHNKYADLLNVGDILLVTGKIERPNSMIAGKIESVPYQIVDPAHFYLNGSIDPVKFKMLALDHLGTSDLWLHLENGDIEFVEEIKVNTEELIAAL